MAHEHLTQNNYFEVAMLALQYYDKAYNMGVQDRNQEMVYLIPLDQMDHEQNAKTIIKFVEKHERNKAHTI
jgi:tRNA 2-selenouridine synthase